jgi:hypothetical protein
MWAFGLYISSVVVFLTGLYLLHVPQTWMMISALVMAGLGALCAVAHLKLRDEISEGSSS